MFQQLLALAAVAAALLSAEAVSDTGYRLNTPLRPSAYALAITPHFDTGDDTAFTFDGEVIITFQTESITDQIKLHSEDLEYSAANITVTSGTTTVSLNASNPLEFDAQYTFAHINLLANLQVGVEYTMTIVYRGPIRTDLNGFYRNYYVENGVRKWLGATQMEPTHARKVFPCFDEPQLKATFTLTVDRPAGYRPSLTNTKLQLAVPLSNGYVREIFYPTPRMSTYLVAFLVSELEAVQQIINNTREFGVYARPDAINQTAYAFDFGLRVVDALSEYFGIDYYSTNNNLNLDHIALPDFRAGAMENWGLIKYREALLLYVPEESSPYYKYRVAQIMAHETTHMWFGNLVTCHWWSDTWLNEGFANYFQDYITALIESDVGSSDMLVTGSVYAAYDADDMASAVAITNDAVNSPAEISGHFGTITYQKAGSVIRMIHHLLGDDAFKFGLNAYLNANRFEAGYPEQLYAALVEGATLAGALVSYPGADVRTLMSSWVTQPGHPVVQVDIDYEQETVTLTQKRFCIDCSEESNKLYKIPITYTTGAAPDFNDTKPVFIMETETYNFTVSNISRDHSWILFNIQETGLYRVNYDDHSWDIITSALKGENREQIHHLNRAKLVNDLFAFLYADAVSFERVRGALSFLAEETQPAVWSAALRGFAKLWSSFLGNEDVLPLIEEYELQLLDGILAQLGFEENAGEDTAWRRLRADVLQRACRLGHAGCLESAAALFRQLADQGLEISPGLRPVAYCSGLRLGSAEDYDFLWQRMRTTNVANEARVISDALGCTPHADRLQRYLVSMLEEDSPIRTQDLTVPLASVLAERSNLPLVLQQLRENFTLWTTIYPSMDTVLAAVGGALRTQDELDDFDSWLSECAACGSAAGEGTRAALTEARADASWARAHAADILLALRSAAAAHTPLLTLALAGMLAGLVRVC